MRRIVLRRILVSIPLIVAVSLLTFVLQSFIPGDAARTILGATGTPEQYEQLRNQLHLDLPLWSQYFDYMRGVVTGDFGTSIFSGVPVATSLVERLPVTLWLVGVATLLSAVIGVLLGVWAAVRGGVVRRVVDTTSVVLSALPNFWVGLLLISVFAVELAVLPATGYVSFFDSPSQWAASLILPWIALTIGGVAGISRLAQEGVSEALESDYIRTLRANGASHNSLLWKHALRNSSTSVLTVVGLLFVGTLSGSVVIENVFALPGLGSLAVTAVNQHDLPVVEGVAIAFTLLVVVANLIVDLLQAYLNPKVRT